MRLAKKLKVIAEPSSYHHADEESQTAREVKRSHSRVAADAALTRKHNSAQPVHDQIHGAAAAGPKNIDAQNRRHRRMTDDVRPAFANVRPVAGPFFMRPL